MNDTLYYSNILVDTAENGSVRVAAVRRSREVQQAIFGLDEARRTEEQQEQEMRGKLRSVGSLISKIIFSCQRHLN